ncbi:MAG: insulinase family protein [Clostridia bacterium]|nr:insulinase family protein [Clostridia bacterium]
MKTNDLLHGFRVLDERPCEDDGGTMITMRHEKTGARLIWMPNDQENKLFSITFRTVPWDDTGVFHILEHSVLCGSDRYPVREPFLELMKSSMNTFLNAMTFPDKTMYPVSSRNSADFMNLVRVYLDAVFHPAIYTNPNIFRQEGWHIELREKGAEPVYKGVVFNEMKGALSGVHRRLSHEQNRLLFPDSPYRFISGGDPAAIPDLTYEDFLQTHRVNYHPSNAYIYLDGDLEPDPVLALLDETMSAFGRGEGSPEIPMQRKIGSSRRQISYELPAGQSPEMQAHATVGKVLADWTEREKLMALDVLASVLADTNESPLKRALLDTGLCRDVALLVDAGSLQNTGLLGFFNTEAEHVDTLLQKARSVAERLAEEGLDREDLSAAIDNLEFREREAEEPAGLIRNINILNAWLYGGDPMTYLKCDEVFASLRARLGTDYYERLLREWLVDESGTAVVTALPDPEYGTRQAEEESRRCRERAGEMGEDVLIEQNGALDAWQQTPDTPEQLAAIPKLPISEVAAEPQPMETESGFLGEVPILRHPARQKGIVSMSLYFSADDLAGEELTDLSILSEILGELPTQERSVWELQRRLKAVFGSWAFSVAAFGSKEEPEACRTFFTAQTKLLSRHLGEALPLLAEVLTRTRLDDAGVLREQLLQMDELGRQAVITAGHSCAMRRCAAPLSAEGTVGELTGGFTQWKRIHALAEQPEEALPEVMARMGALLKKLCVRSRLTVSVTAHGEEDVSGILALLPEGERPERDRFSALLRMEKAQAIRIPAPISYSACALRVPCDGTWKVAASILSLEYLWNEVRVRGGAYGAGARVTGTGELAYYSYRDPSPYASLQIDRKAADFLRGYAEEAPGLEQYIISTIAKSEPLLSDSARGAAADGLWFRGRTLEKRREERRRILATSREDLTALCDALGEPGYWCIVGPETAIEAARKEDPAVESL